MTSWTHTKADCIISTQKPVWLNELEVLKWYKLVISLKLTLSTSFTCMYNMQTNLWRGKNPCSVFSTTLHWKAPNLKSTDNMATHAPMMLFCTVIIMVYSTQPTTECVVCWCSVCGCSVCVCWMCVCVCSVCVCSVHVRVMCVQVKLDSQVVRALAW